METLLRLMLLRELILIVLRKLLVQLVNRGDSSLSHNASVVLALLRSLLPLLVSVVECADLLLVASGFLKEGK